MIKCVITAAGKGSRLLPATNIIPKEMMPIFSKRYGKDLAMIPIIQFIFEQLYMMKIRDFCFVVGRKKEIIKNHFSLDNKNYEWFSVNHKAILLDFYKKIENSYFCWINQKKPLGFGDAVRKAERCIGCNSFIVHAGDAAIIGKSKHPILRLIETAKSDPSISAVLLCKKVNDASRYGVPKIKKISNSVYRIEGVEEKPLNPKSNLGILPLYFFKPIIFAHLKKIKRGKNNEFQLTDAIQSLIEDRKKVVAIPLHKDEYELDVGTVNSYKLTQELSYKKAA